jgi:uncharacterized protein
MRDCLSKSEIGGGILKKRKCTGEFKFKSIGEEDGKFEGYLSIFGNKDSYGDVVQSGAFKKCLATKGNSFFFLADHKSDKPIGIFEASEDAKGLYIQGEYDLNIQLARERYSLAKKAFEKNLSMGLSIGYVVKVWERDQSTETTYLKEIELWEGSQVVFPANDECFLTDVKSIDIKTINEIDTVRDWEKLFCEEANFSNSSAKKLANLVFRGQKAEQLEEQCEAEKLKDRELMLSIKKLTDENNNFMRGLVA